VASLSKQRGNREGEAGPAWACHVEEKRRSGRGPVGAMWRGEVAVRCRQDAGTGEAGGAALPLEPETREERGGGPVRVTAMWAGPGSGGQRPVKRIQLKIPNDFK
jgi:hypothetical protein